MLSLLLLLAALVPLPRRPRSVPKPSPFPVRLTLSVHTATGDATVEVLPEAATAAPPAGRALSAAGHPAALPPPTPSAAVRPAAALAPSAVRPVAALKSGETPRIRWRVASLDTKSAVPHLVVHLLIRRADGAGAPVPDAFQEGSVLDTVFGTDLAPRGATDGEINTALYGADVYQAEIELRDDAGARRQYAAIDLKVTE